MANACQTILWLQPKLKGHKQLNIDLTLEKYIFRFLTEKLGLGSLNFYSSNSVGFHFIWKEKKNTNFIEFSLR